MLHIMSSSFTSPNTPPLLWLRRILVACLDVVPGSFLIKSNLVFMFLR